MYPDLVFKFVVSDIWPMPLNNCFPFASVLLVNLSKHSTRTLNFRFAEDLYVNTPHHQTVE